MKKNKLLFLLISLMILITNLIYTEDINFFTKIQFSNSQFWESQLNTSNPNDINEIRNVFTNFFSGGIGVGLEFIIWDMGRTRGSRLFLKSSIDLIFSGINSAWAYDNSGEYTYPGVFVGESTNHSLYPLNINGGAFYTGLDWDLFFGGTFPRTDLIWGFGCIFNFLFPTYSPNYNVANFAETWNFYAVPAVLLGYDIFIPNTKFKITPQIRVGFTCNPIIPGDLISTPGDTNRDIYTSKNLSANWENFIKLSGIYIDFSVAFSFYSIKWKK